MRLLALALAIFPLALNATRGDTVKVYKHRAYHILKVRDYITLCQLGSHYYVSIPPLHNIRRLNYFNLVHMARGNAGIRPNCLELRRRRIPLSAKYRDGGYFAVKVLNSYIQ